MPLGAFGTEGPHRESLGKRRSMVHLGADVQRGRLAFKHENLSGFMGLGRSHAISLG
jgi:hypothetical protein